MKYILLITLLISTACETGVNAMSPHFISCNQMKHLRGEGLLPANPSDQEALRLRFYEIANEQLYGTELNVTAAELFPCNY